MTTPLQGESIAADLDSPAPRPRRRRGDTPRGLWRRWSQQRPSLTASVKIWSLTCLLAAASVLIAFLTLRDRVGPVTPFQVPWPVIAVAIAVAELKVVEVHFRRETHSFSASELPTVIGFFFLPPFEYLAALVVGSAVAMIVSTRPRPIKLAFNIANFAFMGVVSLTILYTFGRLHGAPEIQDWIAVFASTTAVTVLGALSVATVITLSGGAPQYQKLPDMIQFGEMVALANTSLALLAVSILWLDPALLWLLAIPVGIVSLAYQAYVSEREKHERLELLYQSSRILQHNTELDSALLELLNHARTMFRAEEAEIVLYPRDPAGDSLLTVSRHDGRDEVMVPVGSMLDEPMHQRLRYATSPFFLTRSGASDVRVGMASPLRGETELIGAIAIRQRLTEGTTFSDDDIRLLETLANQAAVALENGHLEQSLAELSELKEQLRYQAFHDPLTGLANRSLFLERLAQRLQGESRDTHPAVLFLDLDDFKVVNDTLGHGAGDHLLAEVAERLKNVLREEDLAARLGGDEFAVLVDEAPEAGRSIAIAERIIDALQMTFLISGEEITVGASIGVAFAGGDERAEDLMRNADLAMYMAKSTGKNRVSVFDEHMHDAVVARRELSAELSRSLGRGELAVYYQPIVDLQSGQVTGHEALVRWLHPTRGLLGPDEFIPLAEDNAFILPLGHWVLAEANAFILPLGHWVLAEACQQAAIWSRLGPNGPTTISVNLSAQQLQEPGFIDDVQKVLADSGLAADRLILEMTETVMFQDTSVIMGRLQALRELGIRIAIDDFGTGYSSLGYLRRFPIDILKIAKEFIGSSESQEDWAFAGAIVGIGRTLGLAIIAEGIEEPGQLERLRGMGCQYGQGYLFARPRTAEKTTADLAAAAGAAMTSNPTHVGRRIGHPGVPAQRVADRHARSA